MGGSRLFLARKVSEKGCSGFLVWNSIQTQDWSRMPFVCKKKFLSGVQVREKTANGDGYGRREAGAENF